MLPSSLSFFFFLALSSSPSLQNHLSSCSFLFLLQEGSCLSSGRRSMSCWPWREACWSVAMLIPLLIWWLPCRAAVSQSRRGEKSSTCPGCPRAAGGTAALPWSSRRTSFSSFSPTAPKTAGGSQPDDRCFLLVESLLKRLMKLLSFAACGWIWSGKWGRWALTLVLLLVNVPLSISHLKM